MLLWLDTSPHVIYRATDPKANMAVLLLFSEQGASHRRIEEEEEEVTGHHAPS